ncbi:arginase family protein [Salegentibacter chungangensis]|uniref:Arginase family protein n=1 Tax=Salegentibacter chungangensis TaxID=1335724 RepID=A0ABW3NRF7_9FLAO
MESIKIYNAKTIKDHMATREGETKFGEKICFIEDLEELEKHPAEYVIFGIPEDIGIRANHGKPGAARTWQHLLASLLNIQVNEYTNAENLILLGEIDCRDLMDKAAYLGEEDPHYYAKLGDLVKKLDLAVTNLVEEIVGAGKIPIIIGGGHNNAFGNIKGSSRAIERPINILNIDAHTDLRSIAHRHSGNGFSCARHEGSLGKYAMFGIHQNYTPQYIFDEIKASEITRYQLFDDLMLLDEEKRFSSFNEMLSFVNRSEFGLEIDCDSIAGFPSSAQTPSGFSLNEVRNYVMRAKTTNCRYLHLCEAVAPAGEEGQTGKALTYLITDFMSNTTVL